MKRKLKIDMRKIVRLTYCIDAKRKCNTCQNLCKTPANESFCGLVACNKFVRFAQGHGAESKLFIDFLRFHSNCEQCPRVGVGKDTETQIRCLELMRRLSVKIIESAEWLKTI
jgi:hypothetical protein